jgi:hypothetical protein
MHLTALALTLALTLTLTRALSLLPSAQLPAQQHHLAEVVCIVVGYQ